MGLFLWFDQAAHILRQRRFQCQNFFCDGMYQRQRTGVQCRTGNEVRILGTVEPVSGEGVPNGCHMNAKLVGSSGFRNQFHQRESILCGQNLVMGNGRGTIRPDTAADGGGFISSNGGVYSAASGGGTPHADCPVFPVESLTVQGSAQEIVDLYSVKMEKQAKVLGKELKKEAPARYQKDGTLAVLLKEKTGVLANLYGEGSAEVSNYILYSSGNSSQSPTPFVDDLYEAYTAATNILMDDYQDALSEVQ